MDRGQLCRGIWESSSAKVVVQEPNGARSCSRVIIPGTGGFELMQDMRWFHASWANYLAPLD